MAALLDESSAASRVARLVATLVALTASHLAVETVDLRAGHLDDWTAAPTVESMVVPMVLSSAVQ